VSREATEAHQVRDAAETGEGLGGCLFVAHSLECYVQEEGGGRAGGGGDGGEGGKGWDEERSGEWQVKSQSSPGKRASAAAGADAG
jgi:hypothetical protein